MEEQVRAENGERTELALPTTIHLPEKRQVDEALDRAIYIASRLIETARRAGMTFTVTDRSGQARESLTADGWRLLASWCGFGVIVEIVDRVYDENGELIRAHARARLVRHGEVFGQADGTAERNETLRRRDGETYARWEEAIDDTLESVAQSRAVAEVCKQNLGFVLRLAGFGETVSSTSPSHAQSADELTSRDWARFWMKIRELGLSRDDLHEFYSVESLKQIIKTREDMARVLTELETMTKGGV